MTNLELPITVHLPGYPPELPTVVVDHPERLPGIPHLDPGGIVCYRQRNGTSISLWDLEAVIVDGVAMALETLESGLRGDNRRDVRDEIMIYWARALVAAWAQHAGEMAAKLVNTFVDGLLRGLRSGVMRDPLADNLADWDQSLPLPTAEFFGHAGTKVETFSLAVSRSDARLVIGDEALAKRWLQLTEAPAPQGRALLLPLERTFGAEGIDLQRLLDITSLKAELSQHLSSRNRELMEEQLREHRDIGLLLLGVPQAHGTCALLGLHLLNGQAHQAFKERSPAQLLPVFVQRSDFEFLLERGGAPTTLTNRSALIVGCGAIGGHLATALARTGIGRLILVDPECLEANNLYRHVLGRRHVGSRKAAALAATIREDLPHLSVEARATRIETLLRAKGSLCDDVDVIINATGDAPVGRELNRSIHQRSKARVFHTWLEPLGIGGNALLTAAHGGPGCYECLFVDPRGREQLHARTDLAEPDPDRPFTRMVGGCAGAYTPFGDVDARRTAELAVRLVLDQLLRPLQTPRIWTWKGDSAALLAAGFPPSGRHQLDDSAMADQGHLLSHARCPVCQRPP